MPPIPFPLPNQYGMPPFLARIVLWAQFRRDLLGFVERIASLGDFVSLRIAGHSIYFLMEPDFIKEVLINQTRKLVKGIGLERARRVLGDGILTSEGEKHRRQRRLAQPAFSRQRLQSYGSAMIDLSLRYRERLRDGTELDMHLEMMRLTLAIVGKTLFDTDVEGDSREFAQATKDFLDSFNFMLMPFYPYVAKLPLPQVRRIDESRGRLDRIIYRIINERRKSDRDHGDLLSMLIAAADPEEGGGGMSDEQLRDECITLMLAGHETTANALTWTLFLLSQHPAVETRLLGEIDRVLSDRAPTVDDLPRLGYVEQVIAESMRLYPPVFMIARRVIEPLLLGDYAVEPGALVFIPIWALHRDARHYPNPLHFDPDRFTPEARAARPRFVYLPFSYGPRNCIGEHFAWMEAVLLLTTLLQRFQFRLAPGQRVEPQPLVTLRSKHGMRMRVCARPAPGRS